MLSTAFGRAQFDTVEPWIAGVVVIAMLFPHLIWLDLSGGAPLPDLADHRAESPRLGLSSRWR